MTAFNPSITEHFPKNNRVTVNSDFIGTTAQRLKKQSNSIRIIAEVISEKHTAFDIGLDETPMTSRTMGGLCDAIELLADMINRIGDDIEESFSHEESCDAIGVGA